MMIEVKNLNFSYEANRQIFVNLNLKINKGEYVALIGTNGSGKSTIAKIISGVLPINAGEVLIDGLNVYDKKNYYIIRQKVGMVLSNPDHQIISDTVEDEIAFGMENLGINREEMQKRVEIILTELNLRKYQKHDPRWLSGGEKQRVAIAGAIVMEPEIIILDEVSSMLDTDGKKKLKEIINYLHENKQKTIINITHNIEEASWADKVIIMGNNRIEAVGTPAEIFTNQTLLNKLNIEPPEYFKILNSLKTIRIPLKDISSMEELVEELCKLL